MDGRASFLLRCPVQGCGFSIVGSGHMREDLVVYGVIILSFMGGAQYGLAMHAEGNEDAPELHVLLGISVLPALIGKGPHLLPHTRR